MISVFGFIEKVGIRGVINKCVVIMSIIKESFGIIICYDY